MVFASSPTVSSTWLRPPFLQAELRETYTPRASKKFISTSLRQPGSDMLRICGALSAEDMTRSSGISRSRRLTARSRSADMRAIFSFIPAYAISLAAPKAAICGIASVPARIPLSWLPPTMNGFSFSPARMYSAPMPFGAWILCPLMLIMSAPSVFARNGTFMKPCTASVCSSACEPARFNSRETAEISVTAPVSLLTIISETSIVSSRSASTTDCTGIAPLASGFSRVTSKPRFSSSSSDLRIASCSTVELIICLPRRFIYSAPDKSAQLSLSEPQDVK